jgi:hypothetical protein
MSIVWRRRAGVRIGASLALRRSNEQHNRRRAGPSARLATALG